MQAEKLKQVKDAVLKLRQQLRSGQLYQSLPIRMGAGCAVAADGHNDGDAS
ncbi:hypothetical protein [Lactiplantibacillus pentosus]|uniref:hypothetical protein n=1 Tax=Lactiplantibacillus pentosus TaxID=1589 RepID=UPI003C27A9EC